MLEHVADGVWVRQSEWVASNATVVEADGGLLVVDPGISGADLEELADDVAALGLPVVAGFCTHPHWDHLLWHPRLGDVPRWATPEAAAVAAGARERAAAMAEQSTTGVPLDLVARLDPLPADGGPLPGQVVTHDAHAPGAAALWLADRGVLVAGDLLSDLLVPILDPRRGGQLDAWESAIERLAALDARVVVPGHGSVARESDVAARLDADRAYLAALRAGAEPDDPRLAQDWVRDVHAGNKERVRADLG